MTSGLVVNPGVIRRNLEEHLPFMASEAVLMHAVRIGGDRQQLHEAIRRHSMEAARRMKDEGAAPDLLERIEGDKSFHLSRTELAELTDPMRFVGRAREQVDRFLESWVEPVLTKHRAEASERVGAPEVRV